MQYDIDKEICPEGSTLFPTKSQVPLLKEYRKVTLRDSKIKYMNKKLFYDIFPSLSSLKLDVGSVKEITLPITKKSLRTLSTETKHDLELINVDNSMPPIKNKSKVSMHSPSPRFELKQINVLNIYFKKFILILEAYQVKISMPKIQKNATIGKFKIDLRNGDSNKVEIDYTGFEGKLISTVIKLPSYPSSFKRILPPIRSLHDPIQVQVTIGRKEAKLVEWKFIQELKKEVKIVTKNSEESLKTLGRKILREKDGKETVMDYIIVDINELIKTASNSSKKYKVNTFFIILSNEISDCNLANIAINYQILVMNNYSRLFGFESDKKITFHQNSYIPETWMSLDVETVYKIINSAVDIVKTSFSLDDPAMLKIKSDISYTLLKEILSQKFIELVTPFIGNHKYYFDKALTTIKDLSIFVSTFGKDARPVPRLLASLYTEKSLNFRNMAENILSLEQTKEISNGQKTLLDITKTKSETSVRITKEQQKVLEGQEKSALQELIKLKDIRKKHETQVKKLKEKFNEAVKKRQARAWFDVFLSFFNAVIGIFSGNLRGTGALSQLKEKIEKIARLIERVTLIIGTLSGLVNLGANVHITNYKAQAGYGADITTVKPTEIDYEKLHTTSKYFDPSQVNTTVDQMSKLDAADVLQWIEAEKEIQSNLDASVTQEVPEGKEYKKALLQLNAAGKAETEAAIKYAQLKSEIYMNRYRIRAYEEETEYIANAIMNFKNVKIDDYKKISN